MSTRFYANNATTPYTPAAWQGSWDTTTTRIVAMDPNKYGSSDTSVSLAETTATSPWRLGLIRLVSRPLAPQTISGTVNLCFGIKESSATADMFWRAHLFVINADTGTILGTLLNQYEESSGAGSTEWPTTSTGESFQTAQTLSSITVPNDGANYVIVAELGAIAYNAVTTSFTASLFYGTITTGSTELADLTAGLTTVTTHSPWIEFSGSVSILSSVPTNVSATNAIDITTLPYSSTINARNLGVTQTLWFKYTPVTSQAISIWPFGGVGGSYEPSWVVATGLPSSLTIDNTLGSTNVPGQMWVIGSTTYYFRVTPATDTASPASLTFDVLALAPVSAGIDDLVIPDDTINTAVVIRPTETDYSVVCLVSPFAAGEGGDSLPSSEVILVNNASDDTLHLYNYADLSFSEIASLTFTDGSSRGSIRANNTADKFYVAQSNAATVKTVLPNGTFGATTWTIPSIAVALAASNDETILYWSSNNSPIIHRYDLVNLIALSDLATAGQGIVDILVLSDNTIVAMSSSSGTGVSQIVQYSSSGTLLTTYTLPGIEAFPGGTFPRIAYAQEDPDAIWLWRHPSDDTPSTGLSKFQKLKLSDGSIIRTHQGIEFELSAYQPPETDTPLSRFGNSFSCPFFQLRTLPLGPGTGNETNGGTDISVGGGGGNTGGGGGLPSGVATLIEPPVWQLYAFRVKARREQSS